MSSITEDLQLFAISSATCGIGSSREVPTSLRTANGLPSSIPWIIDEHLGGSYRPEARMSIRYDTEPDCHNRASLPFWLMRNSTYFRMLQVTTPADLHLSVLHMSVEQEGKITLSLPSRNETCNFHRSSLAHFTTFSGGFKRREKWKSGLNQWCLFFDAVLSFQEITPVKVRISIKFGHGMPANLEI